MPDNSNIIFPQMPKKKLKKAAKEKHEKMKKKGKSGYFAGWDTERNTTFKVKVGKKRKKSNK